MILLDVLDYLRYQVANDRCTPAQLRSIHEAVVERMEMEATAEDLARFYGQKEGNVRNMLSRKAGCKGKRRVYYNAGKVMEHVPKSWRRGRRAEG